MISHFSGVNGSSSFADVYSKNYSNDSSCVPVSVRSSTERSQKNRFYKNLNSFSSTDKKNREDKSSPLFEIFGIKLYADDLLILGLLALFYTQNVNDNELLLALAFLLIS